MKASFKAFWFGLGLFLLCGALARAEGQKWKFLVYGDTRGPSSTSPINTTILAELVRATTNEKPAFVLMPGDLVYEGNYSYLLGWSNIMAPVYQAGIGVYPVRGNHEMNVDPTAYPNFFGPKVPQNGPGAEVKLTYALFYSNVLVLAMDNYVVAHQANTTWMRAVLATNPCLHVFAMGHEPAFKANHTDCLDDVPAARDTFWNVLSNTACRVYFCGHDHFYDHARLDDKDGDPSDDVHQYIVGCGGAPFHTNYSYNGVNDSWNPINVLHEMTNGYVVVEIDGPMATLTFKHRTLPNTYVATSDVFTYSLAPIIASTFSSGTLRLTWSGGGRLESAPTLGGTWTTVSGAASPYTVPDLAGTARFYRVRLR